MTQEEKAKAYDKAIAKSVEFLSLCKKCGAKDTVDFLESIFPELAESEDEKIRKELTEFLKSASGGFLDTTTQCKTFGKWVAWLEKQGKNKGNNKLIWKHWSNGIAGNGDGEPIYLIKTGNTYSLSSCLGFECDYIELSELDNLMLEKQGEQNHFEQDLEMEIKQNFKIGDWITDGYLYNKITDVLDDRYIVDTKFAKRSSIPFKFENYYHLWTLKDAKDGDVLATSAGAFIYNGNNGGGSCPGCYCGINTLGRFQSGVEHHWTGKKVYPATKEQRDTLFTKMHEAGYMWDSKSKQLLSLKAEPRGEQKPAWSWSEEDENKPNGGIVMEEFNDGYGVYV